MYLLCTIVLQFAALIPSGLAGIQARALRAPQPSFCYTRLRERNGARPQCTTLASASEHILHE
jgi:hypothetical protein